MRVYAASMPNLIICSKNEEAMGAILTMAELYAAKRSKREAEEEGLGKRTASSSSPEARRGLLLDGG